MKFYKDMYLSRSMSGKEEKVIRKLKLGIGMAGIHLIAVPMYGSDPLEIYNVIELKQRWYRKNDLLIIGMTRSKKEAEYLSANILAEIFKTQGDYDSRRYFSETEEYKLPDAAGDETYAEEMP